MSNTKKGGIVLMSTATVRVKNVDGNWITMRALLDSASQSNFITSEACKTLGVKNQILISWLLVLGKSPQIYQKSVLLRYSHM